MKREVHIINVLLVLFAIFVVITVFSYVWNFHDTSISKDPAQWGVLGDYFGGVLNPLISIVTLYFLVRNYLIQRLEIQKMEESAKEQTEVSHKTAKINLLQTKISASNEMIRTFLHEMDRVTQATRSNTWFTAMDGKKYRPQQAEITYRLILTQKIKEEREKIEIYLNELDV